MYGDVCVLWRAAAANEHGRHDKRQLNSSAAYGVTYAMARVFARHAY